jgi:hypothetical protein
MSLTTVTYSGVVSPYQFDGSTPRYFLGPTLDPDGIFGTPGASLTGLPFQAIWTLDGTTIVSGDLVINSHDLIFGAQGYLGSSVNIGPSTFNIDLTVALCAPPNCTRTDLGSFYDFTYGSLNAQYPFGFILPGNGEHIGGYFDYGNLHGYLLTRDLSPVLVPAPATFAGEFLAGLLLLLLLCRQPWPFRPIANSTSYGKKI